MEKPRAFGYCRVSTTQQELQQQRDYIAQYYKVFLASTHEWGGFYEDFGVSAFTTNWLERPGGRAMWAKVGVGDAVIIQRLDRAVRSSGDAAECWKHFESKHVDLHCVDGGKQAGGVNGKFAYQIHSAVAELESGIKGARIREQRRSSILRGECYAGTPAPGYSRVKTGTKRQSGRIIFVNVPNPTERMIVQASLDDLRNNRSLVDICETIGELGIRRSTGTLFSRWWMAWAMHCCVLDWPQTFTRDAYVAYKRECRHLKLTPGSSKRDLMMATLAHCEKLMDNGYDFSTKTLGYPHIPTGIALDSSC